MPVVSYLALQACISLCSIADKSGAFLFLPCSQRNAVAHVGGNTWSNRVTATLLCVTYGRTPWWRHRPSTLLFSRIVPEKRFWGLVLRVRPPGIEWKSGRNPKMGKNWPKNSKMALGPKWGKNGPKMARKMGFGVIFLFFGPCFPISARGPLSIFDQFFPIFGFRPVFHSIPGGLTRKSCNFHDNPYPLN